MHDSKGTDLLYNDTRMNKEDESNMARILFLADLHGNITAQFVGLEKWSRKHMCQKLR